MHDLPTLKKALQDAPDNVRLWLLYGQTCISDKIFDEARAAFEQALALDPSEPEALLGVANVLFQQGKLSEAEVRGQAIARQHVGFAPVHLLLTRVYLAEEDLIKAVEHYDIARGISKLVSDKELEAELAFRGHSIGRNTLGDDRPRLVANAGWESEDFDFNLGNDPFDDDLPGLSGSGLEQEEFDFVDDEEIFNFDEFERPQGSFADVAGLDDVKDELLMKLVYPYQYQDLFMTYGKKAGGGVLLYGPPGCGKSLVCRALAGETEASFYTVKLHQILEMYIGCSEKNLNSVFQMARENAPSVIFIDELDALGADRGELKQSAARTVVNQFLMELDGYDGANEGVLVIAATSAIWSIDPAFLRPGRFDRRILVPPPDDASRQKILKMQAQNRPVGELDYQKLSAKMDDYSGADIAQVFELAIEDALRLAMKKHEIVPLNTEMLLEAIDRVQPSIPIWREQQQRRQGGSEGI
tara:strand:- start:3631 stop:5043 length:1413 start_codon:yes stop_codon:yes gene_type:complete